MTEKLRMSVRMSIIPEISKQNYDTLAKQFREVVANAFDADATEIKIKIRKVGSDRTDLIFEDNGNGMDENELKGEYLGVGGSPKAGDERTIGRIGIGSLAVAVLSQTVLVETRKDGADKVIQAKLNIGEKVKNIDRTEQVQEVEIGTMTVRNVKSSDPEHFTRLTLQNVYSNTASILHDKGKFKKVILELRRTLPLKYPENHPLLNKLQADLRDLLLDEQRQPIINVLIGAPCLGFNEASPEYYSLERYAHGHPSQTEEKIEGLPYPITATTVANGVNPNLTIYGYFVDAGAQLPSELRGIVLRVKNMGVELNSVLELRDAAAAVRITGELFIENLDEQSAMTINRNELVKEHADYIAIRDVAQPMLAQFIKEVRGRVNINSEITKVVRKAKGVREAFVKIGEALEEQEIDLNSTASDDVNLVNAPDVDIEQEIKYIDDSITVYKLDIEDTHDVKHIDDEIEVTVKSDLLANTIEVAGEEYKYYLKKGNPSDPPCEIDTVNREIFINVGHPILESRGNEIIKAVIALRLSYLEANGDAEKLYNVTLQILGNAFKK